MTGKSVAEWLLLVLACTATALLAVPLLALAAVAGAVYLLVIGDT